MWISLTFVRQGETADAVDRDLVLVAVHRADGRRLARVRAPLDAVPELVRLLGACGEGAPRGVPCCASCATRFDVPDLDAAVA